VAVGPHSEVDDVEAVGQRPGVAGSRRCHVGVGHQHQVVTSRQRSKLGGVAVGVAVGGDALVDLPHVDALPRDVESGEEGEHRWRRRAARYRQHRSSSPPDGRPQPSGDRFGARRCRVGGHPHVDISPPLPRHPPQRCTLEAVQAAWGVDSDEVERYGNQPTR
jgi:hypothetical protein